MQAFLEGRIGFLEIAALVEDVLTRVDGSPARDLDGSSSRPTSAPARASCRWRSGHHRRHPRPRSPDPRARGGPLLRRPRRGGMRPRKFYLGFGPPLVKTTRNGVEYGIAAFPLGGYVKIPGMYRPAAGDLRKSLRDEEQEAVGAEARRARRRARARRRGRCTRAAAEAGGGLRQEPRVPGARRRARARRVLAADDLEARRRDRSGSADEHPLRGRHLHRVLHGRLGRADADREQRRRQPAGRGRRAARRGRDRPDRRSRGQAGDDRRHDQRHGGQAVPDRPAPRGAARRPRPSPGQARPGGRDLPCRLPPRDGVGARRLVPRGDVERAARRLGGDVADDPRARRLDRGRRHRERVERDRDRGRDLGRLPRRAEGLPSSSAW